MILRHQTLANLTTGDIDWRCVIFQKKILTIQDLCAYGSPWMVLGVMGAFEEKTESEYTQSENASAIIYSNRTVLIPDVM